MDLNIEKATPEDLDAIGIPNVLYNKKLVITGLPKGEKGEDMEEVIKGWLSDLLPEIHKRMRPHFKDVSVTWQ
jgi:hypothetical protein